jgi:hypothetical protein
VLFRTALLFGSRRLPARSVFRPALPRVERHSWLSVRRAGLCRPSRVHRRYCPDVARRRPDAAWCRLPYRSARFQYVERALRSSRRLGVRSFALARMMRQPATPPPATG